MLAYGSVDDIDAWVGGLAEDHVPNALVGPLVRTVLADQFGRLRDGDRFYYENDPFFQEHKDLKRYVEKTKLSDVIRLNTGINKIHQDVFFVHGDLK